MIGGAILLLFLAILLFAAYQHMQRRKLKEDEATYAEAIKFGDVEDGGSDGYARSDDGYDADDADRSGGKSGSDKSGGSGGRDRAAERGVASKPSGKAAKAAVKAAAPGGKAAAAKAKEGGAPARATAKRRGSGGVKLTHPAVGSGGSGGSGGDDDGDDDDDAAYNDAASVAASVASSGMDSDVFFNRLMQETADAQSVVSRGAAEGEEAKYASDDDRPSDVGDDEWDAMLNDVDDEESAETWNEDLSSMLLFKLAKAEHDAEGFASRGALAAKLRSRPDLVDMLGLRGISGDEIEFLLHSVEATDGEDLLSRSQFLRVLDRFRRETLDKKPPEMKALGDKVMPPPPPPSTGDAPPVVEVGRLPAPPPGAGAPLAAEVDGRTARRARGCTLPAAPRHPPPGDAWSPSRMFHDRPKYHPPRQQLSPIHQAHDRPGPGPSRARMAPPAGPPPPPPRRRATSRRSTSPRAPTYVSPTGHTIAPEDVDAILENLERHL